MKLLKNLFYVFSLFLFTIFNACGSEQVKADTNKTGGNIMNENGIFPKGEKASPQYFTGTAWVKYLAEQDETFNYAVGNVVFEPGARNNWHKHPAGQILIVTQGHGYYQEKGKPAQSLKTGDIVKIPAHLEHWHGAAPDSQLVHIVITNNSKNGAVEWLKPVSDQEYQDAIHQ